MDQQKRGEGMQKIQDAKILIVDDNRELLALLKEEYIKKNNASIFPKSIILNKAYRNK